MRSGWAVCGAVVVWMASGADAHPQQGGMQGTGSQQSGAKSGVFAGAMEYMEGIDDLIAGDFGGAADAFGRAARADDENADFFAAKGAALVLGDKYEDAKKSLARALRLQPGHHGATVWQGVITRVGGNEFDVAGQEYCLDHDGYEAQLYAITMAMAEPARLQIDLQRAGGEWEGAKHPNDPDVQARVKAAKAKLPEVAKKYGEFLRSDPRLGGLVFEVAKAQYAKGEYAKALVGLRTMEDQQEDNPEVLYYLAGSCLGIGDADSARRYYTRVLMHWTANVQSYLGRAVAKAKLGDGAGCKKDVEIARGLDANATAKFLTSGQKTIDDALASVPGGDVVAQWDALRDAAVRGEKNKVLIDAAMKLVRTMNAQRKRYDESYQDGLRVRQAAVDANPNDANAAAELADYLYSEVDVRGSGVEERAPVPNWRFQTDETKEGELQHAEAMADRAIALDPNQVTGLAVKAAVRMRHLQWADGETLLKKAMQIDATNGKVLMLFGEVLQHVAAVKQSKAWSLRSTETWEDSQYIYTRYPSQAELAAADQLDNEAKQLWQWASQYVQQAAEARKGTAEGYYWEGFHAYTYERIADAIAPLVKATQMEPGNVTYAELLADAYERTGQAKEGIEERFRALNLLQTTDSTLLRLAWECIKTDRWRSAREFLDRAKAIDPADAKIAAYYALCAEGDEDME
ncbi:MAG TPA: hypothetical protein VG711_04980, partial [Phycisphaerales bacterium]|nr:hypothetical protein [Phycisphaerales bacterium]